MHTVKEIATLLNLTEHTVRFYTDKQLVPHLKRNKNKQTIVDNPAINWLLCIKHLHHVNFLSSASVNKVC